MVHNSVLKSFKKSIMKSVRKFPKNCDPPTIWPPQYLDSQKLRPPKICLYKNLTQNIFDPWKFWPPKKFDFQKFWPLQNFDFQLILTFLKCLPFLLSILTLISIWHFKMFWCFENFKLKKKNYPQNFPPWKNLTLKNCDPR